MFTGPRQFWAIMKYHCVLCGQSLPKQIEISEIIAYISSSYYNSVCANKNVNSCIYNLGLHLCYFLFCYFGHRYQGVKRSFRFKFLRG